MNVIMHVYIVLEQSFWPLFSGSKSLFIVTNGLGFTRVFESALVLNGWVPFYIKLPLSLHQLDMTSGRSLTRRHMMWQSRSNHASRNSWLFSSLSRRLAGLSLLSFTEKSYISIHWAISRISHLGSLSLDH